MDTKCARCGKDPALGWAAIDDDRYCHPWYDDPSCYELAQWEAAEPTSEHLRGI